MRRQRRRVSITATRFFTAFNLYLLVAVVAFVAVFLGLQQLERLPAVVEQLMRAAEE